MDMGPTQEQTIIRQAILNRDPIPDRILNAPQLLTGLEFELGAFLELDTERSHIFGLTQLPMSVIRNYGLNSGLEGEELEEFISLIHGLDNAHLAKLEQKNKSGKDKSSKSRAETNKAN